MTAHTPGPWERYGDDTDILVGNMISDSHGACDGIRQVCVVKQGDYEIPDYWEAHANARLIAAAPELFATLKLIAACDNPTWTVEDIKDLARVAIAKVKGA